MCFHGFAWSARFCLFAKPVAIKDELTVWGVRLDKRMHIIGAEAKMWLGWGCVDSLARIHCWRFSSMASHETMHTPRVYLKSCRRPGIPGRVCGLIQLLVSYDRVLRFCESFFFLQCCFKFLGTWCQHCHMFYQHRPVSIRRWEHPGVNEADEELWTSTPHSTPYRTTTKKRNARKQWPWEQNSLTS